jgi:hypothetical protein
MKDSIIRWVAAFALLAVIAVAAIFVVDDDEVNSEATEEKLQALENKTSNVDKNHFLFKEGDHLDRKSELKKEKFKDKFDRRDGLKKKKTEGKFDRAGRGGKLKKGKPDMSKPLPPMMGMMHEGFMPPMMGMMHEGFMPPMMGEGFMPPMMGEGFMPPMMGEGFMPPMMGEGFMPPMMGEGFEIRESEIFKEIEQIFDSILDSLGSIEELDSADSKTTNDGNSQASELTLSLIEELIKETFDQLFEEEISEIVDRVAKDAITQIIEGLIQESDEQTL